MSTGSRLYKYIITIILSISIIVCPVIPSTAWADSSESVAADVVFVIDSTGSMDDEIESVRNGVTDFVDQLVSAGVDLRVGVLEYRDITCDGEESTIIHTLNGSPWHYTVDDIKGALNNIDADGGGDTPETLVDALGFITNGKMKFRSAARKFAVVLTDASYKLANRHGYKKMDEVLERLQSMAVSTSIITYSDYYEDSWDEGDSNSDYYDATSLRTVPGSKSVLKTSINPDYKPQKSDNKGEKNSNASSNDKRSTNQIQASMVNSTTQNSGEEDLYELSVELRNQAKIIKIGSFTTMIGDSGYEVFSFTPTTKGFYTLQSESDSDTYCYLYNSEGELLYSDDDGGLDSNFKITAKLSPEVSYYYAVRFYGWETEGSFTVSMSYDSIVEQSCSYRDITEGTNGLLAEIDGNFSDILFEMAQRILNISHKSKKAIYILPGYMGSRLFLQSGKEVWLDTDYLKEEVENFAKSLFNETVFGMNEDGGGSKLSANLSIDKYGTDNTYEKMVNAFQEQCKDYDVVFFGYNWLGDLSDSAKQLEKHIQANGYNKVVLVTHSTGGLLAANYISRSITNKKKVEKAILVAPPLYGTYTALMPIEMGKTSDLDSLLEEYGVDPGFLRLRYTVFHEWVKFVTKNSPTTYQLLPSEEYLKTTAIIYKDDIPNPVTTKGKYYEILNGSKNINSNLTNGNSRSHDYFRTSILERDIIKTLKSVDTYLIGSQKGHATPAIAIYAKKLLGGTELNDLIFKKDGDGTVMGISASAQRTKGKYELKYKDFSPYQHTELAEKQDVLSYICNTINGSISKNAAYNIKTTRLDSETDAGMSSYIKFNISCNNEVIPCVWDSEGNEIDVINSNKNGTIYTVLNEEEGDYRSILYLPLSGWKLSLRSVNEDAEGVLGSVVVSLLDDEGYRTASSEYRFEKREGEDNLILFDASDLSVSIENINNLTDEQLGSNIDIIDTEWNISEAITFENIGSTKNIELTGGVSTADLIWSSADESVASVDDNGTVVANGYGKTVITALQEESNKALTCEVTVSKYPLAISVPDINIELGERYPVTPIFDSEDVTEREVNYIPSEEGIIEVDNDVIIGLQEGTVDVTAIAEGGVSTTFKVTVYKPNNIYANSIEISSNELTLKVGEVSELSARVLPENAADTSITWFVKDDSIVAIEDLGDGTCKIDGLRPGETEVYAVSNDGGYSATSLINVKGILDEDDIYVNSGYTYTGKEIIPDVEVYWKGYFLEEGEDYIVHLNNNINAGKATIEFTGIGNYIGTVTKSFWINAKKITPKVTLSYKSTVYDGRTKKPKVTVKYGTKIINTKNYSVSYAKGRMKVGSYKITVRMKGNYSGSKSVAFKIIPKGTNISVISAVSKGFTVKWKKQTTQTTGYQIRWSTSSKMTNTKTKFIAKTSATKWTQKKLKPNKKYYVQIRTYKTVNGTKYYSKWSKKTSIKTNY